ncbi:hypothetical protein P7C70_g7084, partial [Phenoliferia sp. Uapishka_3]
MGVSVMSEEYSSPFPSEIVSQILQHATSYVHLNPDKPNIHSRNSSLANYALVSRQFLPCANRILYGHLQVPWQAGTVLRLLETLRAKPALGRETKSLSVSGVTETEWKNCWKFDHFSGIREETVVAPWDKDDADGLEKPQDILNAMEQEQYVGEDLEDEAFWQAMDGAAAQAWEKEGHTRWRCGDAGSKHREVLTPEEEVASIEELLEVASYTPRLKELSIFAFQQAQLPTKPLDDPRFTATRLLFSRLSSLKLVDVVGVFGGSLVNNTSRSFSLSLTRSTIWYDDRVVTATPTHLALSGGPASYHWPWIAKLADPMLPGFLQHLSFTLHPSTLPLSENGSMLSEWIPYLETLHDLPSLHIRLALLESRPNSRNSELPRRISPSQTDQDTFGAYLATSELSSLCIDWWPNLSLMSSLPSTLINLELGPRYPFGDDQQRDVDPANEMEPSVDPARLYRCQLAGILQQLPQLASIAIPYYGLRTPIRKRRDPRTSRPVFERPDPALRKEEGERRREEMETRIEELEMLGYSVTKSEREWSEFLTGNFP